MDTAAHLSAPIHADETASPPNDDWKTLRQEAERVHVHPATLRRLIRAGLLRHARVGVGQKLIRLRPSWTDAALEASAQPLEVAAETGGRPVAARRRRSRTAA